MPQRYRAYLGQEIVLVESAVIKPSAVKFAVERLQQGWSYVAI